MEYIPAKTIVTRAKSGWFGMDYNMNVYRGCSHGCIYCDSRSECYHIDSFDEVRAKEHALEIIRNDLRRKVKTGVVATGSMSDPYNPAERELQLTRHALELLNAYEFGVGIATKSDLVLRDMDVLSDIKEHSPVLIKVTITTADDEQAGLVEPNAPVSSKRFEILRQMAEHGLYAGVLLMPVLPFLEDSEENVLAVVERAADCGARFIYPAFGMTLRRGNREWYYDRLDEHYPGLSTQYRKQYGDSYVCTSPRAKQLWEVFRRACDQKGLLYDMQEIIRSYKMGYGDMQLKFF
ncbi:MAG: radical SAM protein [Clostridiales bacterium]|nr:MAG: radical SAM protein [Clostridiales bacterium]